MNGNLFETDSNPDLGGPLPGEKRPGPPNRMNDLPYRDWMKFQKSFFRFQGWQTVVDECINFFTKEHWQDGTKSTSLIVGFEPQRSKIGNRTVLVRAVAALDEIVRELHEHASSQTKFDFALINLTTVVNAATFADFMRCSNEFFSNLRSIVAESRYCGVVVEWPSAPSFPVAWALAAAGRKYLKLRDEKIGLRGTGESCYYCLFFQAENDSQVPEAWHPNETQITNDTGRPAPPMWVMPKSPPRKADEMLHPAKFPEKLVTDFIETFSEPDDTVLDPMMGTGSALIAAVRHGRDVIGVDLNPTFVDIARNRIAAENPSLLQRAPAIQLLQGDACEVSTLLEGKQIGYCITSPPYWSMLTNEGSENQKARRERNLPTVYSESDNDIGNIEDYSHFVSVLERVYTSVGAILKPGGYLTVVVKNVKRNHTIYPLAWDLVRRLCKCGSSFEFVGNTLWCQDDVGLKPFAVGIYWVSNTLHTYCLHFRRV